MCCLWLIDYLTFLHMAVELSFNFVVNFLLDVCRFAGLSKNLDDFQCHETQIHFIYEVWQMNNEFAPSFRVSSSISFSVHLSLGCRDHFCIVEPPSWLLTSWASYLTQFLCGIFKHTMECFEVSKVVFGDQSNPPFRK